MTNNAHLKAEIERLVSRYGANTVREHVNRICKGKAGNKPKQDWPHLFEFIEKDARDWLAGRNPFERRTNYSIGKELANRLGGTSKESTRKRFEKKLRAERERAMLVESFWIAERELPYERYFKVVEEVAKFVANVGKLASFRRDDLIKYRSLFGEPASSMTITEISRRVEAVPVPRPVNILQTLIAGRRR
ncbi:MAG: hypothetical protein IT553_00375 [Sphingomonadaceae bacterium]|nr:hypothetical protein [Sphingomonadaceae bacterium]